MHSEHVENLPTDYPVRRESYVAVNEATPLITSVDDPVLYRTTDAQRQASIISHNYVDSDSDVESSLLGGSGGHNNNGKNPKPDKGVYATIAILLVGVFVANTDQSLVIATYNTVASDFQDLESGPWLMSAYILAQCVVQPLYGKLSDIYGRKPCLQASYLLFALGTAGSGLGQSMGQVIAARVIQGAGAAGMGSMVSIVITDLVPLREVAAMRSYVNILHTTGRSCGGVIGGFITQTLSWRWAFLIQVPPTVLAIILVQWRLHLPKKDEKEQSKWEKLKRIDFIGATFLCFTIFAACFVLEMGGTRMPYTSPLMIGIISGGVFSAIAFTISAHYVAEPIFPIRLMAQWVVVTNYAIVILQSIMQMSLMNTVAVYFQATANASTATVGAYLIPAFVGNTVGGLVSGHWIKKTGRYKIPTLLAPVCSLVCVILCYFRWNGNTSIWESVYTLPGGLSMGLMASAAFVALAAGVEDKDIAIAGSGCYLFMNIGAIAGVSAEDAVFQSALRSGLERALKSTPDGKEIIRRTLLDIGFVQQVGKRLRDIIVPCFVQGFHAVNVMGFICAIISLVISVFTPEHRLVTA